VGSGILPDWNLEDNDLAFGFMICDLQNKPVPPGAYAFSTE